MNCYYTNLIEGHDTHPIDIERALKNDYSDDPRKARPSARSQGAYRGPAWIDEGGLQAAAPRRPEQSSRVHRRFCELLPEDLLWVTEPDTGERLRVVPASCAAAT